jgi:parallel beta-helix repeat protein
MKGQTGRVISFFLSSCALIMGHLIGATPALAVERIVVSPQQLATEIGRANPGDVIKLQPGVYRLNRKIVVNRPGSPAARIRVTTAQPRSVVLESNTVELFLVRAPYWTFENIQVEGVCARDTDCEHAFHIVGKASSTTIRNTVLKDFNAAIKANGILIGALRDFPDDVVVEGNQIYNEAVRDTDNPVVGVDVVGGRGWRVRRNYIADLGRGGGNRTSYSAFFKGNGRDGVFERNLVVGSLKHTGGIRVGLSFGGSGSFPDSICELSDCSIEHTNGTIKNNILMAFNTIGIYLNEAPGSRIYSNLIYDAVLGIDVRFRSTATIANNIVSGPIGNGDGGQYVASATLSNVSDAMFNAWFVNAAAANFALRDGSSIIDKGRRLSGVASDFCGQPRNSGPPDIGPIEYAAGSNCSRAIQSLYSSLGAAPTGLANGSRSPWAGSAGRF